MARTITRDELKAKLDRGDKFSLVEALPTKYYTDKHLPGAVNIPHDEIDEHAPILLPDKSAEIVAYCANAACKNSGIAARRLIALGHANVRDYHEGKADWIAAGFPTECGRGFQAAE